MVECGRLLFLTYRNNLNLSLFCTHCLLAEWSGVKLKNQKLTEKENKLEKLKKGRTKRKRKNGLASLLVLSEIRSSG